MNILAPTLHSAKRHFYTTALRRKEYNIFNKTERKYDETVYIKR